VSSIITTHLKNKLHADKKFFFYKDINIYHEDRKITMHIMLIFFNIKEGICKFYKKHQKSTRELTKESDLFL
jgi:hypothetical protein